MNELGGRVRETVAQGLSGRDGEARALWAERRRLIESGAPSPVRKTLLGHSWRPLRAFVRRVDVAALLRGLYWRGVRNALDIRLLQHEVALSGLPPAFDGYRILHITDPHITRLDETAARLRACIEGVEADLCVMTGDYGDGRRRDTEQTIAALRPVIAALRVRDGILATLGNHDSLRLVAPLESLGARVLVNETATVARGADKVHFTGLDDVHHFYSEAAPAALRAAPEGFRIALVHSPEIADVAARAGFALYLSGHTHGGQICLPGGRPIATNLRRHRRFASGFWRCGAMVGYTSRGAGVSFLPLRFNSFGEVTLYTLRTALARGR